MLFTFLRNLGRVFSLSFKNFIIDEGFVYASHIAYSTLLALFPFLIFVSALSGFIATFFDVANVSAAIVELIFETWPADITQLLAQEVNQVLARSSKGLLTLSILAMMYFASNGVGALRVCLNRAYGVVETRSFVWLTLQNILFVVLAALFLVAVALSFIAIPFMRAALSIESFSFLENFKEHRDMVALLILIFGVIACHFYLPNVRRPLSELLPGIVLSFVLWGVGSYWFVLYLKYLASYFSTYAGLASIVIVMIFLYLIGIIFIYGAEFNAATRRVFTRASPGSDSH